MKQLILSGLVAAAFLSSAAHAHSSGWGNDSRHYRPREHAYGSRIDQRQYRQQRLIENGWRSGQLTRAEMRRLEFEQWRIQRKKNFFLSDGVLTRGERAELRRDLERAGLRIDREMQDRERHHWRY